MKISALRLFNVKRFAGRGVAIEGIGDGVNVLCAANEFGKSTSFEALHALFFQPHSGMSGDVKNLRPYSGGHPLVEADISTVEGAFRITKQYYGGRFARIADLATGRIVAQADEAENFIADLIKGGTAGPAGLLWVRQGITGIEKRSRTEEESDNRVRASLLESVQGEVEAVTGGRRMAEILAAAQEARSALVTATGRPKTGGRYAQAIEARDTLAAEEQRLARDVAILREALDKRTAAAARLSELDRPEERQQRRQAIETAQSAFDAAKTQSETLKTAEAELKLVRERRDAAHRDLTAFRSAMRKAGELQERQLTAEQGRADAIARRQNTFDAIDRARADVETAEAGEQDMHNLLARVETALRAREAAERLTELKERLSQAEAIRRALEEGEAGFALLKIPASAIDELQAVELDIAKLRAIGEAARPSVMVAYETDAAVTIDGVPLIDGQERGYDGQAQLSIPGIGRITLRSNRPPHDNDRLVKAEEKRRTLLASLGIDTLSAARERQVRAQAMEAELRELRARLSFLAPEGLPKLREDIAARDAAATDALELKEDPQQVRMALAEAAEIRTNARARLRETEGLRGNVEQIFVTAETALASLQGERAQVEAILGPPEGRVEREQALSARWEELEGELTALGERVEALRARVADLETAEAVLKRARSIEEAVEKEANILRQQIAELNGRIRTSADEAVEEKWRETSDALSAARARADAFENEVKVLQRLVSALEAARSEARDLYLRPVMAELKPLLGLLFDDVSIAFDDKTLLPQTIRRNGQDEDVERLSGGMREQLSVLTRLAFARLLARNGRPAPVILDDALVYSDDDRIEKMFDALHRQSRDQQIIVFSCRQRAFQKLGGNILQMKEWAPAF
ncbi:AAA family ATPase [Terrihabitans sp. B22-R8]|uniref:AAA family ATPase n=1 Tax=Terrihabitans sp. B22-R8 TaxID=3425128 RepID=UPI00403D0862